MDTDAAHTATAIATGALAVGHLDVNVILGTALGVLLVSVIRPWLAKATAAPKAPPGS